jgi:two-component system repressor protein LuxO
MPQAPRILVIEDTTNMAVLYLQYLRDAGYEADFAATGGEGLSLMSQHTYNAVLLDLHLPDMYGIDVLVKLRESYPSIPVLLVTAYGSVDGAVDAMRFGAFDFIMKPFPASRLTTTVQKALEYLDLSKELTGLRRDMHQEQFQNFIGNSPVMQAVFRQIESVAASKAAVFIMGESGTGKELVANAVHRTSPRAPKPFVAINCAAVPRDLMESELFGHVKGAFTNADKDRDGAIKCADGGTLFLDEVCEMSPDLQAKLLRFLQNGAYSPVGSNVVHRADIRIVSATNRDPEREVEDGRFREDLFYRLHVVPIEVPPLRAREDDIALLANHFLKFYAGQERKDFTRFDAEVLALFMRFEWPGNVRQLENLVHQIVVMHENAEVVTADMLPEGLRESMHDLTEQPGFIPFLVQPLWKIEKETILKALKASRNDVPRAAAMLEVSPSTIYRKLQTWRISGDSIALGLMH